MRSDSETVEMELGPFLVVGGAPEWNRVIGRERADARPLSQASTLDESATWDGPRRRCPVASSE